jgi:hypothetical protein
MDIKLINEQWRDYETLVSSKTIQEVLALPEHFLGEQIDTILPNIELAVDGPVVRGLVFLSATYIGEVRLAAGEQDFDVALRDLVANYRVKVGQHEIIRNAAAIEQARSKGEEPPAPEKTVYQTATIKLHHSIFTGVTTINYFGDKRDKWLEKIKSNIPIEVLKRSHD